MSRYLLDTNILLRAADTSSTNHILANDAISQIIINGDECVVTAQVLVEFWVVATRPIDVNGLGWSPAQTDDYINNVLDNFTLIVEVSDIFVNWLRLVREHNIKGKRTHDIRILAVMEAHNISHLLTFNPKDFVQVPNIIIVRPQEIIH